MDRGRYTVTAEWDAEAGVWVASSEDVPGLATGADSLDELTDKLKTVIPELLEANGLLSAKTDSEIVFVVRAQREERTSRAA
jgi:predicted RNase H-like HicB family nuclease